VIILESDELKEDDEENENEKKLRGVSVSNQRVKTES
jgi:hypothetical protein